MNNNDQKLWTYHQTENAENLIIGHPRQDILSKKVNRLVKKNGKILEIGFGDGYLLQKLSQEYDCYGADISVENVEQMRKRIPSVKFNLIGVDGKLPYDDNYFDGFIASEVLEHMTDEELSLCVNEIKRVLKNDGYVIITVPTEENLKENECFCPNCGEKFHKWGHKQVWNVEKIRDKFKDFKIKEVKEFFTPYRGVNYLENFIGRVMFLIRTILNKFVSIPGRNYLLIIQK